MLTITINKEEAFFSGTPKSQRILKQSISVYNEGCKYSKLYQEGRWDGYTKFYRGNKFRQGLLDIVIPVLKSEKVKFIIKEEDKTPFKLFKLNPLLYRHQKDAVKNFFSHGGNGIIIVPTRGGKTFISAEIIRQIKKRLKDNMKVLFLVDGIDLFAQTVTELAEYLGIDENEIGKFNDKNFYATNINVGMIQTLTSVKRGKNVERKRTLNALIRQTNFLIIDECHEYSSKQRCSFVKSFKNLQFRLALSATPFKDDIKHRFTILENFGRIVFKITREELVKRGVLSDDKAFLIYYENTKDAFGSTYREYLKEKIYFNEERNVLLMKIINIISKYNLKILILFNSKEYGKSFAKDNHLTILSGDDPSHIRTIEKNNFLKGSNDILCATNIFKKGITLPEAEVIILADGGQESSAITQKRGRVLGTTKDKNRALLLDVIDIGTKYLSEQALNRLELYDAEFGRKKIEIYEESEFSDLEDSLKNWFNVG